MKLRHATAIATRRMMQVFVRLGLMCEYLVSIGERPRKIFAVITVPGIFIWLGVGTLPPYWSFRQQLIESFLSVVLGPITAARVNYLAGKNKGANIVSLVLAVLSPMIIAGIPIFWYRKRKTLGTFLAAILVWALIGFLWGIAMWV